MVSMVENEGTVSTKLNDLEILGYKAYFFFLPTISMYTSITRNSIFHFIASHHTGNG